MKKIMFNIKMQLLLLAIVVIAGYGMCWIIGLLEKVFMVTPVQIIIAIICYILYKFMNLK